MAHRGVRELRPENTIPSFAHAVELGAHVLEMDVHLSRDGELVVIHDDMVDRVTDGGGAVSSLTLAEIQELDAGYTFSPDGTTYPWRSQGVRIPTLAEVMQEFPEVPKVIEIKPNHPAVAEALAAFLQTCESARGRTLVGSFYDEMLHVFRAQGTSFPTSAGPSETRYLVLRALLTQSPPPNVPYQALTIPLRKYGIPLTHPRILQQTQALGLHVQVWTINEPAKMAQIYRAGVQAVTTDCTDRAIQVLANLD